MSRPSPSTPSLTESAAPNIAITEELSAIEASSEVLAPRPSTIIDIILQTCADEEVRVKLQKFLQGDISHIARSEEELAKLDLDEEARKKLQDQDEEFAKNYNDTLTKFLNFLQRCTDMAADVKKDSVVALGLLNITTRLYNCDHESSFPHIVSGLVESVTGVDRGCGDRVTLAYYQMLLASQSPDMKDIEIDDLLNYATSKAITNFLFAKSHERTSQLRAASPDGRFEEEAPVQLNYLSCARVFGLDSLGVEVVYPMLNCMPDDQTIGNLKAEFFANPFLVFQVIEEDPEFSYANILKDELKAIRDKALEEAFKLYEEMERRKEQAPISAAEFARIRQEIIREQSEKENKDLEELEGIGLESEEYEARLLEITQRNQKEKFDQLRNLRAKQEEQRSNPEAMTDSEYQDQYNAIISRKITALFNHCLSLIEEERKGVVVEEQESKDSAQTASRRDRISSLDDPYKTMLEISGPISASETYKKYLTKASQHKSGKTNEEDKISVKDYIKGERRTVTTYSQRRGTTAGHLRRQISRGRVSRSGRIVILQSASSIPNRYSPSAPSILPTISERNPTLRALETIISTEVIISDPAPPLPIEPSIPSPVADSPSAQSLASSQSRSTNSPEI